MRLSSSGTYIKNIILPGFVISGLAGVITGALIFFYKWGAEFISDLSGSIYAFILERPVFVPVMLIGLVGLALIMAFFIKCAPAVSGGGIPTAEGILRGLITFKWLRTFLSMIVNSYIAFFTGLPLGNEGPSVLIGTALGRGTNNLFNRTPAWDRYVMTGGAAAGFAVATGSPATGIIFALEEVHKRFSPMILMVALSSVVFASFTAEALSIIFGRTTSMFSLTAFPSVPVSRYWMAIVSGVGAGIIALLFIKGFTLMYKLLSEKIKSGLHRSQTDLSFPACRRGGTVASFGGGQRPLGNRRSYDTRVRVVYYFNVACGQNNSHYTVRRRGRNGGSVYSHSYDRRAYRRAFG